MRREDDYNPTGDSRRLLIQTAYAKATRDINGMIGKIVALINEGTLIRADIIDLLRQYVSSASFRSPVEDYMNTPKGGQYDNNMAALLEGESIKPVANSQFDPLIRGLAIRLVKGEVPLSALPKSEAETTLEEVSQFTP